MNAKYWLIYDCGGIRRCKPFLTFESLERFVEIYKSNEIIAMTKVIAKE